jgi:hypothetical protein
MILDAYFKEALIWKSLDLTAMKRLKQRLVVLDLGIELDCYKLKSAIAIGVGNFLGCLGIFK